MTTADIIRFNFGHAGSIRRVAANPSAKWIGLLFVLTAGIAREYDQVHLLEVPFDFVAPVIVSLVASFLIFLPLRIFLPQLRNPQRPSNGYGSFLSMFWMTAPLAWLYAIPIERWTTSTEAVVVNVSMLAVVATWRVLVLTRAVSVVSGYSFLRVLLAILTVTSIYVLIASIGAGLNEVMTVMTGLRNSPETRLITEIAGTTLRITIYVFIISLLASITWSYYGWRPGQPYPVTLNEPVPWHTPIIALCLWIIPMFWAQPSVWRTWQAEELIESERYEEAVDFMSQYKPEQFAAARRIPPSPYDWIGAEHIAQMLAHSSEKDAEWLRQHLFAGIDVVLTHDYHGWMIMYLDENGAAILDAAANLPEGRAWVEDNKATLVELYEFANDRSGYRESVDDMYKKLIELGLPIDPPDEQRDGPVTRK